MKRFLILAGVALMLTVSGCHRDNRDIGTAASSSPQEAISTSVVEFESEMIPLAEPYVGSERPSKPKQEHKLVAFTFDDGPGDYTASLLDGLAERDAHATFFIATNRVTKANSEFICRMGKEGHEVANHTVNHPKLHLLSTTDIAREVADADGVLSAITGKMPALLRPPYGNFTTRVLGAVGKPAIVWSIDTRDCFDKNKDHLRDIILDNVSDGDIILLHEWGEYSKDAALEAMDILAEQGYRFVTVPELFAAKNLSLEAGQYYAAANGKDFEERIVFDKDDQYSE